MTRKPDSTIKQAVSSILEGLDLDDMDGVTGGCQQCASGKPAGAEKQPSAMGPLLAATSSRPR
jgi:hypothetical protein